MRIIRCPYCGKHANLVDSSIVYGKSYGMIYYCECGAYVGVLKGTDKPLGTLANKKLRAYREEAHKWFDPMWRNHPEVERKKERKKYYSWLSAKMGLPVKKTHIAMFGIKQCKQVIAICKKES